MDVDLTGKTIHDDILSITTNYLQQLPNEVISLILEFIPPKQHQRKRTLYQCTLVNLQLYHIANRILWRHIHIQNHLGVLLAYGSSVRRLAILGHNTRKLCLLGPLFTNHCLLRLLPLIPNLEKLSIGARSRITSLSFECLPACCKQLSILKLDNVGLNEASFEALGNYCHKLSKLQWNLARNEHIEWLTFSLTWCPLEFVEISNQWPMNHNDLSTLKRCDSLVSLFIKNPPIILSQRLLLLPDRIPVLRYTWWPVLLNLDISACYGIDDQIFIDFIKSHQQIRNLRIGSAIRLTDLALDGIACLYDLTWLLISNNQNITTDGVRRLILKCCGLRGVKFINCHLVLKKTLLGLENAANDDDNNDDFDDDGGSGEDRDIFGGVIKWFALNQIELEKIREMGDHLFV